MSEEYSFVSRADLGQALWDKHADSSDHAWLWHRYHLGSALDSWAARIDQSFAVISNGKASEQVVATVPLSLVTGKKGRVIAWKVLDSLGGPALSNGLPQKTQRRLMAMILENLKAIANTHDAQEIDVAISPLTPFLQKDDAPRVNPLLEHGFQNSLTQAWIVDLHKGPDQVFSGMEGRARTAIRMAEKMGVEVADSSSLESLDQYHSLHLETCKRTGAKPHPKAYFEEIWSGFVQQGLARVFFARVDGQVVAAENFGVYKEAAVYWTGATAEAGLKAEASSAIQWAAMQWMMANGIQRYETGEAFPGAQSGKLKGLSDFKKSFGGHLHPLYRGRIGTDSGKSKLLRAMRLVP